MLFLNMHCWEWCKKKHFTKSVSLLQTQLPHLWLHVGGRGKLLVSVVTVWKKTFFVSLGSFVWVTAAASACDFRHNVPCLEAGGQGVRYLLPSSSEFGRPVSFLDIRNISVLAVCFLFSLFPKELNYAFSSRDRHMLVLQWRSQSDYFGGTAISAVTLYKIMPIHSIQWHTQI